MVYLPPAFTETREDALIAHIERYDFGMLVTRGAEAPIVSQIPFLLERRDGRLFLQCHLARPNPQVADFDGEAEALVMFAGPHAYISPSWYETGPAVPTWNYASVHAYGPAQRIDDPEWLRGLVRRLSERHEAREPTPWRMEDLPEPYVQAMLTGIIGVELAVARGCDRPRLCCLDRGGRKRQCGCHQGRRPLRRRVRQDAGWLANCHAHVRTVKTWAARHL